MPQLSRVGDMNQCNGTIMRGASTVFANGIQVGLHASPISAHTNFKYAHKVAQTTDGSPSVFAEGVPVLRVGSGNTCGHSIANGSPDVYCP